MFEYFVSYFSDFNNAVISDLLFCTLLTVLFTNRRVSPRMLLRCVCEILSLWILKTAVMQLLFLIPALYEAISSYVQLYMICPLLIFLSALVHRNDYRWQTRMVGGWVFGSLYILCMGFAPNILIVCLGWSFEEVGRSFLMCVISLAVMIPCTAILKLWNVEAFEFISPSYITLVVIISSISFISSPLFNLLLQKSENTALFYAVFHFLFILMELAVYVIFYFVSKEYNELITGEVIRQKQRAESQMRTLTENNLEELRRIRHDLKNHMGVMSGLLAKKDYQELEVYFSQYKEQMTGLSGGIFTGNKVLDTILNTKHIEAEEKGIRLEIKAAVPPVLPMDEVRLCSLVFNLLDNALEAVEKDGCPDRQVYFSLLQKDDHLFLYVRNPISASKTRQHLLLQTEKRNGAHGYGIKIIRQIVSDYNGVLKMHAEDGYFVSEIMLDSEI